MMPSLVIQGRGVSTTHPNPLANGMRAQDLATDR